MPAKNPFTIPCCSGSGRLLRLNGYVCHAEPKSYNSLQHTKEVPSTALFIFSGRIQSTLHNMTRRLIATICLLLSTASAFTGNNQLLNRPTVTSLSPTTSTKLNSRRNVGINKRSRDSSSTQLQMSLAPLGAFAGILTGGVFAGGLHAIAGTLPSTQQPSFSVDFRTNTTARPPR